MQKSNEGMSLDWIQVQVKECTLI